MLENTDCVAALFQRLLLPKKLCDFSFVGSEVDLSEIREFLNPAQGRFPSVQAVHLLLDLGDSSIQLVPSFGQPRDFFREAAAFFPVVPAQNEVPWIGDLVAVVLFMSHPAKLHVPVARHRQAIGCLELVQRIAAEEIETLFQLGLDPRKQRMTFAEGQFTQERLAMQRQPTR